MRVLIRISMLRNVPVVLGQRQIGIFQDVCFDQTRKRVCAFVVSCGMRGKRMILTKHISMISQQFILIDDFQKYRHSDKQETSMFVRDTTGLLVGRVIDYAIDRKTLDVLALEMMLGYSMRELGKRIWIYAYNFSPGCNELSIPLDLHAQPYLFKEGNDVCECPP